MKHELKGVLKYRDGNLDPLSLPLTDRDRLSLQYEVHCILLQIAKSEIHRFVGKLKSSRILMISNCRINPTQYRVQYPTRVGLS